MGRVTKAEPFRRRSVLRVGAGLTAALATGCAADERPPTTAAPTAHPARSGNPARPARAAPAPRRLPGEPAQIAHGPRTADSVALTFHGQGDPAIAHALLQEAERAHAHITVLAVGTWLDEHPDIARRILDGGHDLGNHTLHHRDINAMSEADAYAEITGCADRIRRLTGSIGTWFRPSRTPTATPLVTRLARRAGYPHVLSYDVDSLDFTSPGADTVVDNVTSALRPGSVVSLHFGYTDTVAALPPLLDHLDRRGLSAVTCTELLT
ncbi:polysaccharide deacetylase family protein [Streptomyces sp. NPDC050400]|uniref:polysaccharide deacetylase family protein n=1 Tax=Streptomyces sp. NPDC050400 TaxID=3365610 RepID=UPI0037A03CB5